FSTLNDDDRDSIHYGLSQWYPGYTNFPGANLASMYNSFDSSYQFSKLDANSSSLIGNCYFYNGAITVEKYDYKELTFPSTYNTTFTGTTGIKYPSITM